MKKCFFYAMVMLCILPGCISYEYRRETSSPEERITVYANGHTVTEDYRLLGTATVSGEYPEVSRQKLLDKLQEEARKAGANAVMIESEKILPYRRQPGHSYFYTDFDYDDMSRSWGMLYRDMNINFAGNSQTYTLVTYRRLIRAKFLKIISDK